MNPKNLSFYDAVIKILEDDFENEHERRMYTQPDLNEDAIPTHTQIDTIRNARFLNAIPQNRIMSEAFNFLWHIEFYNLKTMRKINVLTQVSTYQNKSNRKKSRVRKDRKIINEFIDLLDRTDGIDAPSLQMVARLKEITHQFKAEYEDSFFSKICYREIEPHSKKELIEWLDRVCRKYNLDATARERKSFIDKLGVFRI